MDTKEINLLVFDTQENFDKTKDLLGYEGATLKRIFCIQSLNQFKEIIKSELSDDDLIFLVVHVFGKTNNLEGIAKFKASGILDSYPDIDFMYISEGNTIDAIRKLMIDNGHSVDNVFKYHQVRDELKANSRKVSSKQQLNQGASEQNKSKKLGCFPVNGPTARQTQELFVITHKEAIHLIHGSERRMLVSFFVSNDFIHAGTMTIPNKFESDDECHKGDELIYVAQGSVSVMIKPDDFDSASVSVERFEINQGERFFVPENVKHNYVNFGDVNAKVVFFIAPEL